MKHILRTDNLNYGELINDVNIKIENNTINAFIGNDKCNKDTLLRLLCGVLPSNNMVSINYVYMNKDNFEQFNVQFGVVLNQINNQFLFDTVYKELLFPLQNLNVPKKDIIDRLNFIVDLFDLKNYLNNNPAELPFHQKQIVLLAVALMHKPKLLFLENALSFLDNRHYDKIFKILTMLCQEEDLTVIMTTDISYQTLLCDDLYVIDDGKIVFNGSPSEVYSHDKEIIKLGLEIPFIFDLSLKLKFYELVDHIYFDIDRLVEDLWK
jgi:energy-coupling factor transport system ATP-binding protein